jgi:hypothetical protein
MPVAFSFEQCLSTKPSLTCSPQTDIESPSPAFDELDILKTIAKEAVSQLPSGTFIIDLGAADSMKFEPYVREFLLQGKECTYVPLGLSTGPGRSEGRVRDQEAFSGASRTLDQLFVSLLSSLA